MQQPPNYRPTQQPPPNYYQQSPQMPPRRPSEIAQFIAFVRRRPIILIPMAIVAIIVIVTAITATVQSVQTDQQANATATTQAVAPTATPVPTDTPVPTVAATTGPTQAKYLATQGTTLLGSPMSNFVGKLGQPNDHSTAGQSYHFLRLSGSNTDGLIVAFYPGTQQAGDITVATSDPGWTSTEAQSRCMAYMPLDAKFKQKIPYSNNTGYDMVYSSASLAKLFPASDFSDGNGNQVAAGLFDVSYLYGSDNSHIGDCDMIIGEQQTQG